MVLRAGIPKKLTCLIAYSLALIAILAVGAAAQEGGIDKATEAKEHFNMGLDLQKKGDDTLAIVEYGYALKNDPNFVDAHINLGSIYFGTGEYNKALEHFKKATEIDETNADAWANLGRTYYKQRKYLDAETAYKTCLAADENYHAVLKDLGLLYHSQSNWPALIENIGKYVEHVTDDYLAYYLLGKANQKLKKWDLATANYTKATELNPEYFNAYNSLGQVYLSQEKYQQAFNMFKKAVDLKPSNFRALYNMAISYHTLSSDDDTGDINNIDNVIVYWDKFLKVARKNPKASSLVPTAESTLKDLRDLKAYQEEEAGS